MNHAHLHQRAIGILGLVAAAAISVSVSTAPASARTFNFNSAGSMVQQPLPLQFACTMQRALIGRNSACREASDR